MVKTQPVPVESQPDKPESKKDQILGWLAEHPNDSNAAVAERFAVSASYVASTKSRAKSGARTGKRGRPVNAPAVADKQLEAAIALWQACGGYEGALRALATLKQIKELA